MTGQFRDIAVVLLSGGMDSCVAAAWAAQNHDLALIHLTYGQRTLVRERRAFDDIANHYGVPDSRRLVVDTNFLARIGGSALTDSSIPVPGAHTHGLDVPLTYVPFRNAHLIAMGVSWAEVLGAKTVAIGVIEEDSAGYPDCTQAFMTAFNRAVQEGAAAPPSIVTPVIHLSKADVLRMGNELEAPMHLTWSCYQNDDIACGTCDSCRRRNQAFEEAGLIDPIASI